MSILGKLFDEKTMVRFNARYWCVKTMGVYTFDNIGKQLCRVFIIESFTQNQKMPNKSVNRSACAIAVHLEFKGSRISSRVRLLLPLGDLLRQGPQSRKGTEKKLS